MFYLTEDWYADEILSYADVFIRADRRADKANENFYAQIYNEKRRNLLRRKKAIFYTATLARSLKSLPPRPVFQRTRGKAAVGLRRSLNCCMQKGLKTESFTSLTKNLQGSVLTGTLNFLPPFTGVCPLIFQKG